MQPSPPLRSSTVRERNYIGDHDFDRGLSLNAKDDDLTLFKEMQLREKDDYLLHSIDNFDDSLEKLGRKIPIRGESNNLLHTDSDKNDYDWLLTPPDTPLFPSLEDDELQPTNLATRGRVISQPTSVSRSSVAEKDQRPSRGSTHHRSPSPQPGKNTLQLRGRSLSAPHSRPASVLRSSKTPLTRPSTPPTKNPNPTPSSSTTSSRRSSIIPTKSLTPSLSFSTSSSRRPSTPPNKPSTPNSSKSSSKRLSTPPAKSSTPRSVSPTPRRLSNTSYVASSIKRTTGSSASPKLRGWQSNAEGFSLETPPNLRTSLSDRPSSYSRGSSPASRSSRDSRCVSSSSLYSHDQNHFSPSNDGNNDIESFRHATVGVSVSHTAKKNRAFANNISTAVSKKTYRIASPSSVSKRSFDSLPRHMVDHRKTPQNMFRPLMCSVPPSTLHGQIFSRNSSFTTRSNASYDLPVSVSVDAESNDHDHVDLIGEWRKVTEAESGLNNETFLSDNMDELREDSKHKVPDKSSVGNVLDNGTVIKEVECEYKNCNSNLEETNPETMSIPTSVSDHYSDVYSDKMVLTCSFCGESFQNAETGSGSTDVCQECALKSVLSHANCIMSTKTTQPSAQMDITPHKLEDTSYATDVVCVKPDMLEFSEETGFTAGLVTQLTKGFELDQDGQQEVVATHLKMSGKDQEVDKQFKLQKTLDSIRSISEYKFKHSKSFSPSLRSDGPEGNGISVPLKRSNSTKGDVKGVVFASSNIRCTEPSYGRENLNSIKLNYSRSSSTASSSLDQLNSTKLNSSWSSSTASSLDFGSSKRIEAYVQRQLILNNRNNGMDFQQNHSSSKSHNSSLLSPGCCVQNAQAHFEENHELLDCEYGEEFSLANGECCRSVEDIDGSSFLVMPMETTGYEQDDYAKSCSVVDVTLSESSAVLQNSHSSPTSDSKTQTSTLHDVSEVTDTKNIAAKMEVPVDIITSNPSVEDEIDLFETMMHKSSVTSLELENHNNSFDLEFSNVDHSDSHNSSNDMESSHKQFVSLISEKDGCSVGYHELNNDSHTENIHEETTVTAESSEGQKSRNLTWEEATDTVFFCSSIIQDLARKAAEIGEEKEQAHTTPEAYQPVTTISQNPVPYLNKLSKAHTKPLWKPQKIKKEVSEKAGVLPTESVPVLGVKESYDAGLQRRTNIAKPPFVESKCNCTVM